MGLDLPVVVADLRLNALILHVRNGGAEMNGGSLVDALTLEGTKVDSHRTVVALIASVDRRSPRRPPDFGVALIVPVNDIRFVALILAGGENNSFTLFVKIVNLVGLGAPSALPIHRAHGQHDMGVRVSIMLVVNSEVHAHSFGNKLLHAVISDKRFALFYRYFIRRRHDDSSGKLGVPLLLNSLGGVPEGLPVLIFAGSVRR